MIQIYLLTPMDRATLLHVNWTILQCPSSIIIRLRASVDSKLLLKPRNVGNAQTQLGRFVIYMLYKHVCNKYSDKSNRWSLGISLSVASSTVGAISSSPSSTILLIAVHGVPWRIFSKSTVVHTKMGHVRKTTPLFKF